MLISSLKSVIYRYERLDMLIISFDWDFPHHHAMTIMIQLDEGQMMMTHDGR